MRIILKFSGNVYNLMRQLGYHPHYNDSFVRCLGPADYPRFHIYVSHETPKGELAINLHLDQKKPIYDRVTAHSGEYEGELVEKEAERIKQISLA